jgi:uncharacterized protein (DUF2384 family)
MKSLITKEDLETKESRDDLGLALSDILRGISKEWELSCEDLSRILHVPGSTLKGWLAENGQVSVSAAIDDNLQAVLDFIQVYNLAASFYMTIKDQRSWLNTPSKRFDNVSPKEMMMENHHGLIKTKSILERVANP